MSVPHDAEATAVCLRTSRSKASRLILSPRIDGYSGAVPMPIIHPLFVQRGFEAVEGVSIAALAGESASRRSPA
jgi:hypothetical protein